MILDKPMNVCVLVGSLRKASFTGTLANALMSLAPSSMEPEVVEIGHLPFYNQDLERMIDPPPAPWTAFRQRVNCYDGALSAEIDALDHLGRGRAKSKVRCDPLHESISPYISASQAGGVRCADLGTGSSRPNSQTSRSS
jgi:hypothetical protein